MSFRLLRDFSACFSACRDDLPASCEDNASWVVHPSHVPIPGLGWRGRGLQGRQGRAQNPSKLCFDQRGKGVNPKRRRMDFRVWCKSSGHHAALAGAPPRQSSLVRTCNDC
eukprot:628700-Prymnesium_polylepis.1